MRLLMAGTGAWVLCLLAACGGGGGGEAEAAPPVTPPVTPPALPAGWTRLQDMPVGLAKFGVAAVGGRLYVTGGYDTRSTVFVYDIAANTWASGPALVNGSDNVAAVAAGGKVHALGGEARTAMQVYDPALNSWVLGPPIPSIRFASAAAELAGRIHLVGGWNYSNTASGSLASHEAFSIATQTWQPGGLAPMPTARNAAAAGSIDGKLYVAGGRSPGIRATDQQSLAALEVYTPASNSWAPAANMPTARGSVAAAALGGRLYVMGGETSAPAAVSDAVERFDPVAGTWSVLTAMPYRAHGLGVVVVGTSIYVMGGFTGTSDAVGTESRALYRYTPP